MTRSEIGCLLCIALTAGTALAQPVRHQEVEVPVEEAALEPPVLTRDSPAPWPETLQEATAEGAVSLELLVSAEGAVEDVVLVRGVHPLLDAAAVEAAHGLRFQPARLEGEPVAVKVSFEYRFVRPPQRGTVAFEVRARGTRTPILGAQLFVEAGGAEVTTDEAGRARLSLPPGTQAITVMADGYRREVLEVTVVAREEQRLLVRLAPSGPGANESVVVADKLQTHLGKVALKGAELREVPGTLGDPLRVVMLMPGVAQMASGVGYPVVRGSVPAATATFVDGVRVPILFHLLLGPSVVHPDALDRIDFTPGLPSARRGRLLAGTVEASLRPVDEPFRATVGADLINAGGVVESRLDATGTELLVGGRFSYSAWLLAQAGLLAPGGAEPGNRARGRADFFDYLVSATQPIAGGRARVLAVGSSDVVGVDMERADALDMFLVTRFHRLDLRDRRPLGAGELEVGLSVGTQTAGLEGAQDGQRLDLLLDQHDVGARASWSRSAGDWNLGVGADVERIFSGTRVGTEALSTPLLARAADGTQAGVWGQAAWTHGGWSVVGGVRGDLFHLVPGITRATVDPRLSVRRALGADWTVQLAAGLTHQTPTALLPVPVVDLASLRYGLQEAAQLDASVSWTPAAGVDVHVNGYATRLTRTVELDLERLMRDVRAGGRLSADPTSRGSAMGVELMVRKHLGGVWHGWVSYALQRSVRSQRFVEFDVRGMPVAERVQESAFAFDQTHVGNVALNLKLGAWTLGAVVKAATGRPESGQLSTRTQVRDTDPVTGTARWRPANADEVRRLPGFVRLDLRAAHRWTFDDAWMELSLDVMNATLSQEVLGYTYFSEPTASGAPALGRKPISIPLILPLIGLKAEL